MNTKIGTPIYKHNEKFLFKTTTLKPKTEIKKRELSSSISPSRFLNGSMDKLSTSDKTMETNIHEKSIYENEDKYISKDFNYSEEEKSQNEKQNTTNVSKFSCETDQKSENDSDTKLLCKKRKPVQKLEIYSKRIENDRIEHVNRNEIYEELISIIQNKENENDGFYKYRYCASSLGYLVKEYGFSLIVNLLIEYEKIYGNNKMTKEVKEYLNTFKEISKNRYLVPESIITINKSQLIEDILNPKPEIKTELKKNSKSKKTNHKPKTYIKLNPRRSSRIKYNNKNNKKVSNNVKNNQKKIKIDNKNKKKSIIL